MRKLIAVFLTLTGVWLASCQKDSSGLSPAEESTEFENVTAAAARYAVATDSVTVKKCKGKLTEVATADLSAEVTGYIASAYAGATVKFAAKDAEGKVIVAITLADGTVKGLLFNADGTFNTELKEHPRKAKLVKVEITALPSAITTYISANYAGAEVKQAGMNGDGEYFIGISADGKGKVLLFNADGSFKSELEKPALHPGKPGKPGKR